MNDQAAPQLFEDPEAIDAARKGFGTSAEPVSNLFPRGQTNQASQKIGAPKTRRS